LPLSTNKRAVALQLVRSFSAIAGLFMAGLVSAGDPPMTYGEMDADAFEKAAKSTYSLEHFSDRYRASLEVSGDDDVFRPGVIRVYDKASGAALIEVKSDEMVVSTQPETGQVKTNVQELPYGEQSVLIYRDFNFDGIKDLALMDGQNSCYHGPSFQVFLGTAQGFRHSDSFTELAQSYCGMFGVDEKRRELSTMTKDGCCWHQMATYSIRNGEPFMDTETVVEYSAGSGLSVETVGRNTNGKMAYTTRTLWQDDDQRETLLAFKLAPSGKRIVLFRSGVGGAVYYAAVDGKDEVSLVYPQAEGEQLTFDEISHALSFVRGDTTYRILGDAQGVPQRMQVAIRGKTTDLKLLPEPASGSLNAVAAALKASAE